MKIFRFTIPYSLILFCSSSVIAATLQVGPDFSLKSPAAAAKVAKDGDTVEIQAGTYKGDVAVWRQNNLTLRGVKGRARLQAGSWLAQDKAIWVIKGNNTVIENIEFSNASVEDHNGAGIRQEGAGLTVRNCYFHHNENGILSGSNAESDILIEHSEFDNNGYGDGYTHNIYIGQIRSFTLRFSYSHHADIGHQVKSRARKNFIQYNYLADHENGQSSYLLDLPNGGESYIIGNILQQGPDTENSTLFSYGAEKKIHPGSSLYIVNNTFINDRHTGIFINAPSFSGDALIANNIFTGKGHMDLVARFKTNIKTGSFDFARLDSNAYALPSDSPAINSGTSLESINGVSLKADFQYSHPTGKQPRVQIAEPDIGAYEFSGLP